ncbi:hypothetical protein VOLCADRAFT_99465 [Volvox carteri f. nagariensis]|uniref:Tubulin--tyrosine ligase-like protein 5 n=1 Tax=Volvox carteri f. nagariensis TaxID=3068 RepID=D8UHV4_VOLCA|nr:uncharacterized protein VOLCADRAFT_99465 [Volvox carteri f. nagariensis]EFJ40684.1 hypothetical protein VOLCADRAFT_99465 [Volvox carteri f. nagariensis]|eukprot:XP_002958230.1 hypothetical protein VOLCADRAFT_99465 [Volvox carteri f. nagariensis]
MRLCWRGLGTVAPEARQNTHAHIITMLRHTHAHTLAHPHHRKRAGGAQALSSPRSAELVERALAAAGGLRAGGPPKTDTRTGVKKGEGVYGYQHMDAWDVLWSVTAKAALAADLLRSHQMLAIIPGLLAVSRKTTLIRSLRDMLGEAAWDIVPRSYKLPDELDEWGQWVAANPDRDSSPGLWMLKNNKQRGTGLRLVRTSEAFTACFETISRPDLPPGLSLYRWYLAQQYVARPLLVGEVLRQVRAPPHSCFQFFGLDFLIDQDVRPWLLEVNATPSMKVEHCDPRVAELIFRQKWAAVRDMVGLLGLCPARFEEGSPVGPSLDRSTPAYALQELRRRGGFLPLMHLLPHPDTSTTAAAAAAAGLKRPLPWTPADRALRRCKNVNIRYSLHN